LGEGGENAEFAKKERPLSNGGWQFLTSEGKDGKDRPSEEGSLDPASGEKRGESGSPRRKRDSALLQKKKEK